MKTSNQCVFAGRPFFRLLRTAILILMVGGPLHTSSASAASGNSYTGNYVIENSLGRTVVPLPDGTWHKVHEETHHQDLGSGDFVSGILFQIIYLVQLDGTKVSGFIQIKTNKEQHGADYWAPGGLCYVENWKHISQESVLNRNTFCWGVRYVRFSPQAKDQGEKEETDWNRAFKKIEAAGWQFPFGSVGTLAQYVRSGRDKMLNVSYFFLPSNFVSWMVTRDWFDVLKPRVQAGFQGKILTPPKGPAASPKSIHPSQAADSKLTGDEIRALIIGKTVHWSSRRRGNEGKWHYRKDGGWSGACCAPSFNTEPSGTWKIEGNKLCQSWEKGPSRFIGKPRCYSYHKTGRGYSFRKGKRRAIDVIKIVDGNPDRI